MIFIYRCNDKSIGSLHYDLLDDVIEHESDTRFGHWLATQDDDINVSMERGEIRGRMSKEYLDKHQKTLENIDETLLTNLHKSTSRLVRSNWHPCRWVPNGHFVNMCNTLGNGLGMTKSKFCFRCGAENTLSHTLNTCTKIADGTEVGIDNLLLDEKTSQIENVKLHDMIQDYRRHTLFLNCCGRKGTAYLKRRNVDILCIAPTIHDRNLYRVMYLDGSHAIDTLNLRQLHREGRLYLSPERVSLEDYLV